MSRQDDLDRGRVRVRGDPPLPRVELAPGYDVCPLIIGCWQLSEGHGGSFDRRRTIDRLLQLAEAGFDTFDGADIYTGVEELLGELRRSVAGTSTAPRLRLHTKLVPDLGNLATLARSDVEAIVDRSLRRLGTEALDLVQLHWWDFATPGWVEAAGWLDDLRKAGKLRHIGVTNFDAEHLRPICDAGVPVVSNQVQYSLLDRRPEATLVPFCRERGIQLLAYGALAGGFLGDGWVGRDRPEGWPGNRSLVKYRLVIDEVGGWAPYQELLRTARSLAGSHGLGVAEVAMRWVLERPGVAGLVTGFSRHPREELYRRVLTRELGGDERRRLAEALARLGTVSGDVYGVERVAGGPHATIMRKGLNKSDEIGSACPDERTPS